MPYNGAMETLAIIGGGASGLAAAVAAAAHLRVHALRGPDRFALPMNIVVYERDDRVGRSILATGNGRCNFSNASIDPGLYYNGEFVAEVFAALEERAAHSGALQPGDLPHADAVHALFVVLGLVWREEGGGRQYPRANKASTVLDVLRAAAAAYGVRTVCDVRIDAVEPPRSPEGRFTLRTSDGAFERVDAVVVACGGRAADSIELPGCRLLRTRPVLGPLRTKEKLVRELDNIRVRCAVSLMRSQDGARGKAGVCVARERGELMFRKYGVSGIVVFNLSRFAWPGDVLSIDMLPSEAEADARGFMCRRAYAHAERFGRVTCDDVLRGLVLPPVAHVLVRSCGLALADSCDDAACALLADALGGFSLTVEGIGDAGLCQVHRGGFSVEDFDATTLESRSVPGLYAAGEALDVDAPCGGYNLHWAWASGMLAGIGAAARWEGSAR